MNTTTTPTENLHFTTTGVSCSGCANSLRIILGKLSGVVRVEVNVEAATAAVEVRRGELGVEDLNKALEPAGYSLAPAEA